MPKPDRFTDIKQNLKKFGFLGIFIESARKWDVNISAFHEYYSMSLEWYLHKPDCRSAEHKKSLIRSTFTADSIKSDLFNGSFFQETLTVDVFEWLQLMKLPLWKLTLSKRGRREKDFWIFMKHWMSTRLRKWLNYTSNVWVDSGSYVNPKRFRWFFVCRFRLWSREGLAVHKRRFVLTVIITWSFDHAKPL